MEDDIVKILEGIWEKSVLRDSKEGIEWCSIPHSMWGNKRRSETKAETGFIHWFL